MKIYQNLSLDDLPNEEWRDVVGWEALYQVSNLGRVKSFGRNIKRGKGIYKRNTIILRPQINRNGYLQVYLFDLESKRKIKYIHQMVLEAFSTNPHNYTCIDHIDGNPLNNFLCNLKYCTQKENMNNPITKERLKKAIELFSNSEDYINKQRYSQPHSRKVLQISMDGSVKEYKTISEAARTVGITVQAISRCCHGKCKTSKGYKWKFN